MFVILYVEDRLSNCSSDLKKSFTEWQRLEAGEECEWRHGQKLVTQK